MPGESLPRIRIKSSGVSETFEVPRVEAKRAKVLRFPTLVAEPESEDRSEPSAGDQLLSEFAAPPEAGIGTATPWRRFALVRRRRSTRGNGAGDAATPTTESARPTVSQLITWMLNLRRGGVGFLYWNAAKLPLDVALVRAARLDDAAIIDVIGHRVLVVEPLRPAAGAVEVR